MKINNQRESQNTALDHSADTEEPFNFLTIDATLLVSDPLRFRKNLLPPYKNDSDWSD